MKLARMTLRTISVGAIALVAGLLAPDPVVHAYKGQCSQPSTNGLNLTVTDCLYVLKVAVGLYTCSPACACAPKGTMPTKASDALLCLRKSVGQPVSLLCPCPVPVGDDFNDNSRDPVRWLGADGVDGNGVLTETGNALEYSCGTATAMGFDQSVRYWIGSLLPYATDWEVQADVANSTVGTANNHVNSYGISIVDVQHPYSELYAELYVSRAGGPPSRSGFYAELSNDDVSIDDVDTGGLGATTGAVRIAFDAGTRVMTLYYDADTGNGYNWVQYGSFGVAGAGGANASTDWGMNAGDRFSVSLYGYSSNMSVMSGQMRGDNFQVTGGVMP